MKRYRWMGCWLGASNENQSLYTEMQLSPDVMSFVCCQGIWRRLVGGRGIAVRSSTNSVERSHIIQSLQLGRRERTNDMGGRERERELNCAGEANLNASLSRFCYSAQPLLSPPSLFSSPLPPLTAHQHLPLVLYSLYFAALQTHLITPIQVDFSLFFFFFISSTCILSMCCVYSSFNSSLSPSLFFYFADGQEKSVP